MDRHVDMVPRAKLEPTTAESLAARAGVVAIDFCHRGVSVRQWGLQGFATPPWATIARLAVDLAKSAGVDLMRIHLGDDTQTIRVLVDGDDALVVVYTSECTYHKSMARAMRRVLRVLKEQRKAEVERAASNPRVERLVAQLGGAT